MTRATWPIDPGISNGTLHWWVIRHLLLRMLQGFLLTLLFLALLVLAVSIPDRTIAVGWHIALFAVIMLPGVFFGQLFLISVIRVLIALIRWATGRPPRGRVRRRRDDDSGYDSVYLTGDGEAREDDGGGFFDDFSGGGGGDGGDGGGGGDGGDGGGGGGGD